MKTATTDYRVVARPKPARFSDWGVVSTFRGSEYPDAIARARTTAAVLEMRLPENEVRVEAQTTWVERGEWQEVAK